MTHYIDTHIHLDQLAEPAKMLAQAESVGVGAWVVPGVSPQRWSQVMATTELHAQIYAAPGIHPQAADQCREIQLYRLRQLLTHDKAVAIGEVGLDRQLDVSLQLQEKVFIEMIHCALEMEKPLLLHTRRSSDRVLKILQQEGAGRVGGIFHAFSGSLETARKIVDMGFVIGIGGVVTYATARRLPEVVREIPAEALVLETDAPEMSPEPHRYQLNRPEYLRLIAEQVALLRDWSLEETARISTTNACRVLRLPPSRLHQHI